MAVITLTTDFGTADGFVGAMKGVILGIAPGAALVDLSHEVPPQDVLAGALLLEAACPHFPDETIHLAVVDPGVGGRRAAIAVRTPRALYVGPDNGLLTLILDRDPPRNMVRLTNPAFHRHPVSATFHGRDVFAPVAAHLAAGAAFEELGEPHPSLVRLEVPRPAFADSTADAHVLHVDRFGNLVLDVTREAFDAWAPGAGAFVTIRAGGAQTHGIRRTYSDVAAGALAAYWGSGGRLELAVRNGSAAAALGLRTGDRVQIAVEPRRPPDA